LEHTGLRLFAAMCIFHRLFNDPKAETVDLSQPMLDMLQASVPKE
jgi:hypothetical protein